MTLYILASLGVVFMAMFIYGLACSIVHLAEEVILFFERLRG